MVFKKSLYLSTAILFGSLVIGSASYGMLAEDIFYTPVGHSNEAVNHHKIIGADVAHERQVFGEGVKVAVIDMDWFDCESDTKAALTETTKQRMTQIVRPLTNDEAHGNMVSSLIAGKRGIAPKVQLEVFSQPANTIYEDSDKDSWSKFANWSAQAIRQAIDEKADFINMSLGFGDVGSNLPKPVEEAFYAARDAGIGIILSAGNELQESFGTNYVGIDIYPNFNTIIKNMNGHLKIAVATGYSKDLYGKMEESSTSFSNFINSEIWMHAIAGPGEKILSCRAGSEEIIWDGTSCTAPMITGAAALVLSSAAHLKGKGAAVFQILDESARKTMLNPTTREYHRKIQEMTSTFWPSYQRYSNAARSKKAPVKSYEEYLEESYQYEIALPRYSFGQGVVNIPAALDFAAQQRQALEVGK